MTRIPESFRQSRSGDFLGEPWTFLIVRDLLCGPKRFKDHQISLEGIGSNLLSERLKSLDRNGIMAKAESKTPTITLPLFLRHPAAYTHFILPHP